MILPAGQQGPDQPEAFDIAPSGASRILKNQDLTVSAGVCREREALLNTILRLCGAEPLAGEVRVQAV